MKGARMILAVLLGTVASAFVFAQTVPTPDWVRIPPALEEVTVGGIARWQWIALGLLLVLSLLVGHVARWIIAIVFRWRYKPIEVNVGKQAERGVKRSLVCLAATGVWWLLVPELGLANHFHDRLTTLLQIVTVLAFISLGYSLWDAACDILAERTVGLGRRTEKLLVPITRKFVRVLIVIAGGLIVLGAMGVNVSGILAGVGIGGLVVALAAKDSVENIFGSFTILFDMPFALGDWVKIGAIEGKVEEINLRSTRIRTAEDSVITLPNSNLIRASVENLGARRYRRLKFTFGVSYETPPDLLEAFTQAIRDMLATHSKVRHDVFYAELNEFTDASLRVLVECGTEAENFGEELKIKAELLVGIHQIASRLRVQLQGAPKPPDPTPMPSVAQPAELGDEHPAVG